MKRQIPISALALVLVSQASVMAERKPVDSVKDPRLEINVSEIRILMRDAYGSYAFKFADASIVMSAYLKPDRIPAEYAESIKNPEMRDANYGSNKQAAVRSTDRGRHWRVHPHALPSGGDGARGILTDGTAIAIAQRASPVKGKKRTYATTMWVSKDNWLNITGPESIYLTLPEEVVVGKADSGAVKGPSIHSNIITLENGDLITAISVNFAEDHKFSTGRIRWRSVLVKSTDNGKNWKYVSTIASMASLQTQDRKILDTLPQGFGEPELALLPNGELLAVIRTGATASAVGPSDSYDDLKYSHFRNDGFYTTSKELTQPLYTTRSTDGGQTWAKPKAMKVPRGVCPRLLTLSNGVVALAYGRIARPSQGDRIIFSTDNGKTWTNEIDIYPGMTTGYTSMVEAAPNKILYVFDVCTADGPKMPDWVGVVDIDVKLKTAQ